MKQVHQPRPPFEALLNVEEAGDLLGIGQTKVYDLMRKRQLDFVKIGGATRIELAAIRNFIELHRVSSTRRIPARRNL